MSSFFSRSSSQSASAASSLHSKLDREAPTPTHEIFTIPLEGIVPTKKWEYNEEQLAKVSASPALPSPCSPIRPRRRPISVMSYPRTNIRQIEQLREYSQTLLLPESDPYHVWEKRFLSDPGCHPRYMRAAKWKLPEGKTRIKGTIEWRREFRPELIKPGDVGIESETGKM